MRVRSACLMVVVTLVAVAVADEPTSQPTSQPSTAPATMPATTRVALPSAQEVMDRYIAATGGRAAYESLTSRRAEGTFSMADLGVEGKMTVLIRRDGNAVVSIDIPKVGTIREGVTSGVAWSLHPTQGPRILKGDEADVMRRSLELSPGISLDGYTDPHVTDVVSLNGRPSYRMLLGSATGTTETRLYDVESGLLVRTIGKSDSPLGELTITSNFTDYEDAPPIRMPMKVQQMLPGASPESAMTKVEHNVELPDALFALPPEIVELQKQQAATQPATMP